ncbi:MAG TPA: hypothetical protein VMT61_08735 [Candidatus Binataceae bacterium]|nr:hypothetical protein [Candidatus Binataceae bacterium]
MNLISTERQLLRYLPVMTVIVLIAQPGLAHAYVGPAATMNFFGAAFGLIAAILSAIGVLLFWPMKIFLRFVCRVISPAQARTVESESAG